MSDLTQILTLHCCCCCRQSTLLEDKLETLANQIGQFGLVAALITFASMAGQFSWQRLVVQGQPWDWSLLSTYLKYAITAITILVSLLVLCPAGFGLSPALCKPSLPLPSWSACSQPAACCCCCWALLGWNLPPASQFCHHHPGQPARSCCRTLFSFIRLGLACRML